VRLFRHTPNRGRGFTRTRTLDEARGKWMVLWDADDYFFPRRLAAIDQARREGYEFRCSNVVVVDQRLRIRGIREYGYEFPTLNVRYATHGSMACEIELARRIGYRPGLTTFGQMGEDVDIAYLLPLRHRGKYESEALMINMIGNEVGARKGMAARSVKLRLWQQLYDAGEIPIDKKLFRSLIIKERMRNLMICCVAWCPGLYQLIQSFRMRGPKMQNWSLSSEQAEFLEDVRRRFPPEGAENDEPRAMQPLAVSSA
jgi:glycosyltransferase involved in cell wall biosynthesis